MKLTVVLDTWFKARPVLSHELGADEKVLVPARSVFEVHSHCAVGNHVRVAFQGAKFGAQNRNTWYCFKDAISIEGNELNNHPVDAAPMAIETGKRLVLPGNQIVTLDSPILPGGHFTWAEATHDGSRIPASRQVVGGIIRAAQALEEVRSRLGDRSIQINSWYRPPHINRAVGGASRSRHVLGDAVDFVHADFRPAQVRSKLDAWWGISGGLANAQTFTHLDCRGYKARWVYGK